MWIAVLGLGFTQTLAWASSTYLIAIIAHPVARDLGMSISTVFAAFSLALIVMGFTGPVVGRLIDRHGGRGVLSASNLVMAAGLVALALAPNGPLFFGAWVLLGVGMAMGLYDAAFATLVRIFETGARGPITGITLIAGFASTVGWPVTALISELYGWRVSCFAWAALHVLVALPINLLLIPKPHASRATSAPFVASGTAGEAKDLIGSYRKRALTLIIVFASMASFVTSAMAAHLPGLLLAAGILPAAALAAAALIGPAQVAARFFEFVAARRFELHPLLTARLAVALHPIGAVVLILFGAVPSAAVLFSVLHGAGNGMTTIARGTLPLAIFGSEGYGHRQGVIGMAARAMQAMAPYVFGIVLERFGAAAALVLTIGCSLAALAAAVALRATPT